MSFIKRLYAKWEAKVKMNIKYMLLVALPLIILGCGGGSENNDNNILTEIEGTWRSNCVTETVPQIGDLNVIVEFTIKDNASTQFKEFFATNACQTSIQKIPDPDSTFTLGDDITTSNGDTAKRMDITYTADGSKAYGIYKKEDDTVLLWVNDETKRIDDNGVMRFNELRYDVIFSKQ